LNTAQLHKTAEFLVVALARTGDRQAFAELVNRHQGWVRGLFLRLNAEPTMADDLAQQTFLQAWKDITQLRDPNKFGGWLKQIAVNVWRGHWRKHVDEGNLEEAIEPQVKSDSGLNRDLQTALATLSTEVRTCIVLAYHEGMKHEEIAITLELPLGTVKSHIRRGSQKLREQLKDYIVHNSGASND